MTIDIPKIPEEQKTELVILLLEIIEQQGEIIQELKDVIARLKGHNPKPKITPSRLEPPQGEKPKGDDEKRRPGSEKRHKSAALVIHEERKVPARDVPKGSIFKGYKDFTVQGLVIRAHNVRYLLECWQTPDGSYVTAELPPELREKHFSPELIRFVLYQYHHCHVTQPLLVEQLREFDIDISSGQISNILVEDKDDFHQEKDAILTTGLEVSNHVNVDDTGARHQGKNGYCTHIGNELFSWFESTPTKSRINFLRLLRGGRTDYVINSDAVSYWELHSLPRGVRELLCADQPRVFADDSEWDQYLQEKGVQSPRHIQITTEGALIGSIIDHGISNNLVIVSDDAGQFNVLRHALCWIHAERSINKIIPMSENAKEDLERVREQLWKLYEELKGYKANPQLAEAERLSHRFDEIFTTQTHSASLNKALKRIYNNKSELLLVLQNPEIPLHNNLSENAIREYVKKRKISGGTRSEAGRRSRDTFASLKKTCRKLGVSFWDYLGDRLNKIGFIPNLADLIRCRAVKPG
ncbi:MAG: transposase [Deltaproteobacteria bacterium]|nr:transposase [Deltaproteobacteria bacterium]